MLICPIPRHGKLGIDTVADSRPRHSAWKNGCDSLIVVDLDENWTSAIRCQVSGVRCQEDESQDPEASYETSYEIPFGRNRERI